MSPSVTDGCLVASEVVRRQSALSCIVGTAPEAASAAGKWAAEANQERHLLEALLGRTPTSELTAG